MNPSNYPPGVTGNEPHINGDAGWEFLHEVIDDTCTREAMTDVDAFVAWQLGIAVWKETRKLQGKFPHETQR